MGWVSMARLRVSQVSAKDLAAVGLPALALIAGAFWLAAQFIKPAPPKRLVLSTGTEEGAYHAFGLRYRDALAREGITVELRPSSGSVENMSRLRDPDGDVDVAFVQSGHDRADEDSGLVGLGSIYYEPVWVFYRGENIVDKLAQLKGKRLAVGAAGSGTRQLAARLLEINEAVGPPTQLVPLGGLNAALALKRGEVDAVFLVGPAEIPAVRILLFEKNVRLMSFVRAPAYTRLLRSISAVSVPQGAIDLVHDVPSRDTLLLAPTAMLVAREDTHPALVDLLMQAMTEVHGQPGVLQALGEFPNTRSPDFPLSKEAQRYYKSGPPFLQRYMPFWAATLVDRIFVMLLPLIAVLLPVMKVAPMLYTWRIRSKIYRWYGELKYLEHEIRQDFDPDRHAGYSKRLDELEAKANTRPIPLAFTDQVYTLRTHIGMVRGILDRLRPPSRGPVTEDNP